MADTDVTVSFGADTSALDAAVTKVKTETQNLVPGGPGSGILTPLPPGLGGPPADTLLARATAAAKAAREAGTEMRNFAAAEDEAGASAGRAGINIGALMERIALRLVIFQALRLAIQGVKYAIDQISNLQQAEIQFDAMADGADHLAARFQFLKEQAAGGLIPPEKGAQIIQTLQDYGASADQASLYVKDLGEWSKVLGVDANTLAQALGRVSEGEGSLQDMRLVTHMMGEQSAEGRKLIQTYIDLQKAQKNLVVENEAVDKSMAAAMRATKEMVEDAERGTDRQMSLLEKLAAGQAKKEAAGGPARTSWGALAVSGAPDIGRALEYGGMIGAMRVPQDAMAQYKRGLEEIGRLEGTNAAIVRAQVADKTLGYQDVMRAGREATEDEMRNLDRADRRRREQEESRKSAGELAITAAKADIARVLPQAVSAPPAALFGQYTESIKGIGDKLGQEWNTGIEKLFNELVKIVTSSDQSAANTQNLFEIFSTGT